LKRIRQENPASISRRGIPTLGGGERSDFSDPGLRSARRDERSKKKRSLKGGYFYREPNSWESYLGEIEETVRQKKGGDALPRRPGRSGKKISFRKYLKTKKRGGGEREEGERKS